MPDIHPPVPGAVPDRHTGVAEVEGPGPSTVTPNPFSLGGGRYQTKIAVVGASSSDTEPPSSASSAVGGRGTGAPSSASTAVGSVPGSYNFKTSQTLPSTGVVKIEEEGPPQQKQGNKQGGCDGVICCLGCISILPGVKKKLVSKIAFFPPNPPGYYVNNENQLFLVGNDSITNSGPYLEPLPVKELAEQGLKCDPVRLVTAAGNLIYGFYFRKEGGKLGRR